jgi:pimeloyl-ACP methyl ester carboxylesterase
MPNLFLSRAAAEGPGAVGLNGTHCPSSKSTPTTTIDLHSKSDISLIPTSKIIPFADTALPNTSTNRPMPYVNNNGVNIRYEVVGTGPPLIACHGLFGNVDMWTKDGGWADILSPDSQLIIPEIRAHGKSDAPTTSSQYSVEHRMSDVIAVMDNLGIQSAAYFGYSMGAAIGFGLAGSFEDRFSSFVLGGTHPYPKDLGWVKSLVTDRRTQQLAPDDFDLTPFFSILDHDEAGTGTDPTQIQTPCLFFYGGEEHDINEAQRVVRELPYCEYLELAALGHRAAFAPSDELTPAVLRFLRQHA